MTLGHTRRMWTPPFGASKTLLYMAHPKWPKTPSDPLNERTEYYCERDIEEHMRRWCEAASEKRLSPFELPTDAFIYHPSKRDQWIRLLR